MIFRLYYITQGGHTHCRLFSGKHDGALGKCGDFTMRIEEFAVFKAAATFIQFRDEAREAKPLLPHEEEFIERHFGKGI